MRPDTSTDDLFTPTAEQLSPAEIAKWHFGRLESALSHLAHAVRVTDAAMPAYAARLPYRVTGKPAPEFIDPEQLWDVEARAAAGGMLMTLRDEPDQDIMTAQRLPGLVAASAQTLARIEQVNVLKKAFYDAVQVIHNTRAIRRKLLLAEVPNVNLMQCWREIKVLEARPVGVAFTWAKHSGGTKKMTVAEAAKKIGEQARNPSFDVEDEDAFARMVERTLARLAALPSSEIVAFREPVAPHPRANIFVSEDEKFMRNVSLPLFYPQQPGAALPPVTPLAALEMRHPRIRRRSKYETEPMSALFGLYRMRENARCAPHPTTPEPPPTAVPSTGKDT